MGVAANFCSSYPSQPDLSEGGDIFCFPPPPPPWAATASCWQLLLYKESCSHCKSVYCSQVMLKINSQQQHQQKALTDCLMCWHSCKLLNKKSNTLSLFSSLYTSKLLLRQNVKRVWDPECHPAGEISGSGVRGFRREKKVDPGFEGKGGSEPLTQPQLQLVIVVVFPSRVLPSRASLRHQRGKQSRAVYIPPQWQKRLLVHQLSQDTNHSFPYSFLNNSLLPTMASRKLER